jgi:hypothetical protein
MGHISCTDLAAEHIAPNDEYLTQSQYRQAARQKDSRELAEVKDDEPPLPMIPRPCGMCSRLLFFDLDHWLCEYGGSVDVGITGAGQVGREKLVDRPAG